MKQSGVLPAMFSSSSSSVLSGGDSALLSGLVGEELMGCGKSGSASKRKNARDVDLWDDGLQAEDFAAVEEDVVDKLSQSSGEEDHEGDGGAGSAASHKEGGVSRASEVLDRDIAHLGAMAAEVEGAFRSGESVASLSHPKYGDLRWTTGRVLLLSNGSMALAVSLDDAAMRVDAVAEVNRGPSGDTTIRPLGSAAISVKVCGELLKSMIPLRSPARIEVGIASQIFFSVQ